ncbi:hypothetical protein FIBSPDRAFT_602517 [Athelia psychrophila]|uniref:Helicase C-terminal domain-containing protein n=1 Tax=Athelia psychrophila TaxID=1759441 RepID=A0A167T5T5_9AGAM|nr:hypothetical protein FIBSPDRAFT_602517 [Fibularhizoctonia sp. CBS 109695]
MMLRMNTNAREYGNLPCRVLPVGLVITPTKVLSANIVPANSMLYETNTDTLHIGQRTCSARRICYRPGESTDLVADSLDMTSDDFTLLRRSNERSNTQLILESLTHGLGRCYFPCLLPYLKSGRKTVIHCRSMDLVLRGYIYVLHTGATWWSGENGKSEDVSLASGPRRKQGDSAAARRRSALSFTTIAFANGLNIKTLLDSISLGVGDTMDHMWQEKGRVGRDPSSQARGAIFVQQSVLKSDEENDRKSRRSLQRHFPLPSWRQDHRNQRPFLEGRPQN